MILDGIDLGIGSIVISHSQAVRDEIRIPINRIDIYSKDNKYKFTFWTQQEYEKFNALELNQKIDVLHLIDDYDIDFSTEEYETINSRENTEMYFTRIDKNKYIINAKISNFDNCVMGNLNNHKTLELETIIDFNKIEGEVSYE